MKKFLLSLALVLVAALSLVGCTKKQSGTAGAVAEASKMTLAQLEAAAKKEMEESDTPFSIIGLTSALGKAATTFAKQYDWLHYGEEGVENNITVKNDYKDYSLLTALEAAKNGYVADYALVQDERNLADYVADGLLFNYIPSDWEALGLTKEDTQKPLKGIHFNKLFYTNTNFQAVTGQTLHNIWQLAGSEDDQDHISKVSFQTPVTEQINMSFLLSAYAPENQDRIQKAYKSFYGKDWSSDKFASAGEQWVAEFIANISRWHSSDGTAMKETQLKNDWNEGYVYYGAFAKMKDAVGKEYEIDITGDGQTELVNAMTTVKWDWAIEGFNGFMYTMDSQIINNAKHPYTACLYARSLLLQDVYSGMIFNKDLPGANDTVDYTWNTTGHKVASDHAKVNQYGYYFPGKITDTSKFQYAKGDWTKEVHMQKELVENYDFLKTIKGSQVNNILALVSSNKKTAAK